jgi:hypothetical protein
MKNLTTIKRDTNYSFIKVVTNENGETFERKLEKGKVDYSNACMMFHSKKVSLEVGNQINF